MRGNTTVKYNLIFNLSCKILSLRMVSIVYFMNTYFGPTQNTDRFYLREHTELNEDQQ